MVDLVTIPEGQQKSRPRQQAQQAVEMSEYQKNLLEEIKKNPELVQLFKVIFDEYPKMVRAEMTQRNPHASRRQKQQGQRTTMMRLKMEAYIEATICKFAGIEVKQEETVTEETATQEEIKTDSQQSAIKERERKYG